MNKKILWIILLLLIIILVVISVLFIKYNFFSTDKVDDADEVPDISGTPLLSEIITDEISKVQTVDDFEFRETMLQSNSEMSLFTVMMFNTTEYDIVVKELKVYFLDIDGNEIYCLSIDINEEDLMVNPMMIMQNIDKDLSNTYEIKYELVY
jgi:hypothetical protein